MNKFSNPEAVLLKRSFQPILAVANDFLDYFYEELFRMHPEARALFSVDRFPHQKELLGSSLVFIVDHVEDQVELQRYLKALGKRHVHYGTQKEHFEWVGTALIESLKYFYADNWTQELERVWLAAYGLISQVMSDALIEAAKEQKEQKNPAVPGVVLEGSPTGGQASSQLSVRVDKLAFEILYASMQRQAESVVSQVVANLRETMIHQAVRDEVKKQVTSTVSEVLKSAIEFEANQLMMGRSDRDFSN
jgi:hemoglobin-like flavoprotein